MSIASIFQLYAESPPSTANTKMQCDENLTMCNTVVSCYFIYFIFPQWLENVPLPLLPPAFYSGFRKYRSESKRISGHVPLLMCGRKLTFGQFVGEKLLFFFFYERVFLCIVLEAQVILLIC